MALLSDWVTQLLILRLAVDIFTEAEAAGLIPLSPVQVHQRMSRLQAVGIQKHKIPAGTLRYQDTIRQVPVMTRQWLPPLIL